MKLSVVMPVFNERQTIREITRRVIAVPLEKEIIIVDDASTDGTGEILKEMAKELPIILIREEQNSGRGKAVRIGIGRATGDIVIAQDADLEYDPSDYTTLIQPILEDRADVVYGSRFKGTVEGMSTKNYLGNKFLTFLCNMMLGTNISDLMTAYKLFRTDLIRDIDFDTEGFEFEAELTAKLNRHGVRLAEVPISYHGRGKQEGKKIGWRDAIKTMQTLKKYR